MQQVNRIIEFVVLLWNLKCKKQKRHFHNFNDAQAFPQFDQA
jgi:hypothetical protein